MLNISRKSQKSLIFDGPSKMRAFSRKAQESISLAILGIVAVIAVVGLVLVVAQTNTRESAVGYATQAVKNLPDSPLTRSLEIMSADGDFEAKIDVGLGAYFVEGMQLKVDVDGTTLVPREAEGAKGPIQPPFADADEFEFRFGGLLFFLPERAFDPESIGGALIPKFLIESDEEGTEFKAEYPTPSDSQSADALREALRRTAAEVGGKVDEKKDRIAFKLESDQPVTDFSVRSVQVARCEQGKACRSNADCAGGSCMTQSTTRGLSSSTCACGILPPTSSCGNGKCEPELKEDANTCPKDCGTAGICGDKVCDTASGEDAKTCPADCTVQCPDDGNPCTSEFLDPKAGCVTVVVPDGTACQTFAVTGTCQQAVCVSIPITPPPTTQCGNGVCDVGEGPGTTCQLDCPDCASGALCSTEGSTCTDPKGSVFTCAGGAWTATVTANPCGDGKCDPAVGEDARTCPADCSVQTLS